MKKISLLAIVSLALVGGAFAQGKPTKKPTPAPKTIACSVMTTEKVDVAKATKSHMYSDYKGRRYFFCCEHCIGAFKKDPSKFSKSASIATPVAPKKKK